MNLRLGSSVRPSVDTTAAPRGRNAAEMATAPFRSPPGSLRKSKIRALERPVLVQPLDVLDEILPGVLLELGDANPPVSRFDQFGLHALHANDVGG